MLHVLYLCSARFAAKDFGGPEKSALALPSLRFPAKSGKSAKRAKFGALFGAHFWSQNWSSNLRPCKGILLRTEFGDFFWDQARAPKWGPHFRPPG